MLQGPSTARARLYPHLISRIRQHSPLPLEKSFLLFQLLRVVYGRYPDLRPPSDEEPAIDSDPRWENVVLPASVPEADLDQLILSALELNWRKTARIIGDLVIRCQTLAWPINAEMLAARIQALVEAGRIESAGDLRAWRHSEVRLTGR
jgi:uncharacterized protein DUF3658